MKNLSWILIVLGCAGVFLSLKLGKEINYFKAHDSKRWIAIALFFGGAALAIVGIILLE